MGAGIDKLEVFSAKERISKLNYARVQELSDYWIGRVIDMRETDESEIVEARFFSESEEVRFFRQDGILSAVRVADGDAEFIDEEFVLSDRFSAAGKSVTVRYYLEEDEDGQIYVSATRLVDIKEA